MRNRFACTTMGLVLCSSAAVAVDAPAPTDIKFSGATAHYAVQDQTAFALAVETKSPHQGILVVVLPASKSRVMASLKAGRAQRCVLVSQEARYNLEQQAIAFMTNAEVAEQFAMRLPPSKEHDDAIEQVAQMRRMGGFAAAIHGLPLLRCTFGDHLVLAPDPAPAASAGEN